MTANISTRTSHARQGAASTNATIAEANAIVKVKRVSLSVTYRWSRPRLIPFEQIRGVHTHEKTDTKRTETK